MEVEQICLDHQDKSLARLASGVPAIVRSAQPLATSSTTGGRPNRPAPLAALCPGHAAAAAGPSRSLPVDAVEPDRRRQPHYVTFGSTDQLTVRSCLRDRLWRSARRGYGAARRPGPLHPRPLVLERPLRRTHTIKAIPSPITSFSRTSPVLLARYPTRTGHLKDLRIPE